MLAARLYQLMRVIAYRLFSSCENVEGKPLRDQPVLMLGRGRIVFGRQVRFGVRTSPCFLNGYAYIEARDASSTIEFGHNVWINNSVVIVSRGEGVRIGNDVLMGTGVEIVDSDFHELAPDKRWNGKPRSARVVIGDNVFIGSNARVLPGISIGNNSVVANSAVVTKSVPVDVVVAGNPARIVGRFGDGTEEG